jgi:hypothetical protein
MSPIEEDYSCKPNNPDLEASIKSFDGAKNYVFEITQDKIFKDGIIPDGCDM